MSDEDLQLKVCYYGSYWAIDKNICSRRAYENLFTVLREI